MLVFLLLRFLVIALVLWFIFRLLVPKHRRKAGVTVENKCQKCDGYGSWQGTRLKEVCLRCNGTGINTWRD